MKWKKKKQTENKQEMKEKKIPTLKVGTHKKSVIALWAVLIVSVSFGVYKNFTAIDMHTVHEKETVQLRLNDTNGIEILSRISVKPITHGITARKRWRSELLLSMGI